MSNQYRWAMMSNQYWWADNEQAMSNELQWAMSYNEQWTKMSYNHQSWPMSYNVLQWAINIFKPVQLEVLSIKNTNTCSFLKKSMDKFVQCEKKENNFEVRVCYLFYIVLPQ